MIRRPACGLAAFVIASSLSACTPAPDARYRHWREDGHAAGVTAYRQRLDRAGVGDVVPMPALLRSSRRWRTCADSEFQLPPPALQPAMAPTLRLVRELHRRGLLTPALARSGYRDPALNRCSGGNPRSRHLSNQALDFDLPDARRVAALCAFWREHGTAWRMGLGFYAPTRIHVDASGHRTWGGDHRRGSSLCLTAQGASGASSTRTP